jgi:hypothetical protein
MHIADRPALERVGCACYRQMQSRTRDVFVQAATA